MDKGEEEGEGRKEQAEGIISARRHAPLSE